VDERKRTDPEMAAMARRAAALFIHWQRKESGGEGELAVLGELGSNIGDWTMLVCALLNVGTSMAAAARDGHEDAYLDYVIREASLDEVSADAAT
jgi:hypothetical protein